MVTVARLVAVAALTTGAASFTAGLYLPAKAELAQLLLRRAWAETEFDPVRPWPWADTWPVARLTVPGHEIDQIVLAGAEGASLAFAPGHVDGTAAPGETGNIVIAGHRDTVFEFLGRLRLGDEIRLDSPFGQHQVFVVDSTAVVHERDTAPLEPTPGPVLTLVTCYPLDGTRPDGPLRYVVRARSGRTSLP
jgi:sortase A